MSVPNRPTSATPDPRDRVTDVAFKVAPELLEQATAPPWRRLMAIAIDTLLVGLLSLVSGNLLVVVAAAEIWRWAGRQREVLGRVRMSLIRVTVVGLALVALVAVFVQGTVLGDRRATQAVSASISEAATTALTALALESGECADADCARPAIEALGALVGRQGLSTDEASQAFDEYLAGAALDEAAREDLRAAFEAAYARVSVRAPDEPSVRQANATQVAAPPSVIDWARGILRDLGLGLGWAAVYFSGFTSWGGGRTPGKRLLRIRVVRLDGQPMSLWDAFGRYGGYGAGLATGLLGFLQVYWDANRQAIQDKIAGTVVVLERPTA